ncbi:HdeD family acid-resistance protein [Streptomyces sp. NPDC002730]|uniref:HdeD family acid-resistance protein n=1 Tax=Streptomyces sp. NPDC002730 TaxID=3364662 RepID=UPI00368D89FF
MNTPSDSATTHGSADPNDVLADVGGAWTWLLGVALVTLAAGIIVLVWPDETLHVLAVIIGLYLLISGAFRFVTAFSRDSEGGGRVAAVLVAVVAILAGVLCLRHPLQTTAVLSLVVGAYWLVSGLLAAFVVGSGRDMPHRGLAFAVAILGIVAGIVVLAFPVESATALARLLGLWLVLMSLGEVAVALALRSAAKRLEPAQRPTV